PWTPHTRAQLARSSAWRERWSAHGVPGDRFAEARELGERVGAMAGKDRRRTIEVAPQREARGEMPVVDAQDRACVPVGPDDAFVVVDREEDRLRLHGWDGGQDPRATMDMTEEPLLDASRRLDGQRERERVGMIRALRFE